MRVRYTTRDRNFPNSARILEGIHAGPDMEQNTGIPTLNHLFFHHLDHVRHDRLLSGGDRHYSSDDFAHAVFALRQFLRDGGLADGERIGIFAENRPEWHIADFAILLSGNIVVP